MTLSFRAIATFAPLAPRASRLRPEALDLGFDAPGFSPRRG